jgi:hypothetical protein
MWRKRRCGESRNGGKGRRRKKGKHGKARYAHEDAPIGVATICHIHIKVGHFKKSRGGSEAKIAVCAQATDHLN